MSLTPSFELSESALRVARQLETYKGVIIMLIPFHDDGPIARATPGRSMGTLVDPRHGMVYVFWNVDQASVMHIKERIYRLREKIDRNRRRYVHPSQHLQPPSFGVLREDQERSITWTQQWTPQENKSAWLRRLMRDPALRRRVAMEMPMYQIMYLEETSQTFQMLVGAHQDFWFAVLQRWMQKQSAVVSYHLIQLEQFNTLGAVRELTVAYRQHEHYRALFYSVYQSVYLTSESRDVDVLLAALETYQQSGRPAPWNPNEMLPDTFERGDYDAGAGMYEIAWVLSENAHFVRRLYGNQSDRPQDWRLGYVRDNQTGKEQLQFSDDVMAYVHNTLMMLVKSRTVSVQTWRNQSGEMQYRWRVVDRSVVKAIKMFPPECYWEHGRYNKPQVRRN